MKELNQEELERALEEFWTTGGSFIIPTKLQVHSSWILVFTFQYVFDISIERANKMVHLLRSDLLKRGYRLI